MIKTKVELITTIMACSIIAIGFSYLFLVTFMPIPQSGQDHAKTIVGFILGVGISTLLNYYWGSSKGSQAKSETLAEEFTSVTKTPNPPIVTDSEVKPSKVVITTK